MSLSITTLTYGGVINKICQMVGHPVAADPAGSTDPAVQQMGAAVNYALLELLTLHEWQDLIKRDQISIVGTGPGTAERGFALPLDFYRFIDQTQWSSEAMMPAGGPISPQGWQIYIVGAIIPVLSIYWQMRGDLLYVLSPPFPTPVTFKFMYLSNAQVVDQDDTSQMKNVATKNGDTFFLDSFLITLLGRARYLEWKGFDASAAVRDFISVFNSRAGSDKGATVLSTVRRSYMPLINPLTSLPPSNYGA